MNKIAATIQKSRYADLLLLGFDSGFEALHVFKLTCKRHFNFVEIENSFALFQNLKFIADSNPERLPEAIIGSYENLSKEQFLFIRNMRNDRELRHLPIVLIAESATNIIDKKTASGLGIDDIYCTPFDWKRIQKRLEFLIELKLLIKTAKTQTPETQPLFKINRAKRIFDICAAGVLLLLASPLLLLIAIAIKLESKGPVIYSSKRVGTGYQIFNFLKFRSMYMDADQRLKELEHLNAYAKKADSPTFLKFENDPRITRVGKFIRKTSIDELPQLVNVMYGDMSLVGNRPLPLYEAEQLTRDEWARRFLAPAGITGLWQVSPEGKENLSVEERINLDIQYAKKYSLRMDFAILLKTLPAMLQKGE